MAGIVLMALAIIFLIYSLNRSDYFMYVGAFGGSPAVHRGFLLLLFCFLPDPPPIFGFSIDP